MTHDILCYRIHDKTLGCDPFCQCEVIAKVRNDERSNNFTPDDFSDAITEMQHKTWIEGYNYGINKSVQRLKALAVYDCYGGAWIGDPMNTVISAIKGEDP